jgi:hypothetical protein
MTDLAARVVADVVPLEGKPGHHAPDAGGEAPGLQALLRSAGVDPAREPGDVSFALAPHQRMGRVGLQNAAGHSGSDRPINRRR